MHIHRTCLWKVGNNPEKHTLDWQEMGRSTCFLQVTPSFPPIPFTFGCFPNSYVSRKNSYIDNFIIIFTIWECYCFVIYSIHTLHKYISSCGWVYLKYNFFLSIGVEVNQNILNNIYKLLQKEPIEVCIGTNKKQWKPRRFSRNRVLLDPCNLWYIEERKHWKNKIPTT